MIKKKKLTKTEDNTLQPQTQCFIKCSHDVVEALFLAAQEIWEQKCSQPPLNAPSDSSEHSFATEGASVWLGARDPPLVWPVIWHQLAFNWVGGSKRPLRADKCCTFKRVELQTFTGKSTTTQESSHSTSARAHTQIRPLGALTTVLFLSRNQIESWHYHRLIWLPDRL